MCTDTTKYGYVFDIYMTITEMWELAGVSVIICATREK